MVVYDDVLDDNLQRVDYVFSNEVHLDVVVLDVDYDINYIKAVFVDVDNYHVYLVIYYRKIRDIVS